MSGIIGLGVMLLVGLIGLAMIVVWVFYLLNLQRCFDAIHPQFRPPVPSALVWLSLVPGLGLLVMIAAVVLLSTSLKKEDEARGTTQFGDGGLALGLGASICGLLSWIPVLGILLAIASLACWVMHWLKVSAFRKLLAAEAPAYGAPAYTAPQAPVQPSYAPPPAPVAYTPPPATEAAPAYTPPAVPDYASPPATRAEPAQLAVEEEATKLFVPPPVAKLVCVIGPVQGMTFPVGNGVVIGRSPEANVVVPDAQISSRHAWVGPVGDRLVLRDLQSTNGSYLNDNLAAPVQETELKDGDLIVLGKHDQMKFRLSLA